MPTKAAARREKFWSGMGLLLKELELSGCVVYRHWGYATIVFPGDYKVAVFCNNHRWGAKPLPKYGEDPELFGTECIERFYSHLREWLEQPKEMYKRLYPPTVKGTTTNRWHTGVDYALDDSFATWEMYEERNGESATEMAKAQVRDLRPQSPIQKALSQKPPFVRRTHR